MSGQVLRIPHWHTQLWAGLSVFMLLVMETTTTSLWYQSIFTRDQLPWGTIFSGLFAIFTSSYLLPHLMEAARWKIPIRRAAFAAWILLAGFASLKLFIFPNSLISFSELVSVPIQFILDKNASGIGFFHLIAIILLAWRGASLSRFPLTLGNVQASFQLGLISILLYGMFYAPMHPWEAIVGLYIYLFCGLAAMSLNRIANLSETRGGRVPRFGSGWLASIMVAGLAVVGLAITVGWVTSGQISDLVVRIFFIILGLLTALVLLLLSPLLLWMAQLLPLLADFINELLERFRHIPLLEQGAKLLDQINQGITRLIPYMLAGRGIFLAGILLALVAGALLALHLRRVRREITEEESQLADRDVNSLSLQKLLQRMLRDARGIRLRRPAQILAAARIRQIYRHLMTLSQNLGVPRPPSMTPFEFLPQLNSLFTGEQGGLERITNAYVSVRYGNYPESAAEVEEVQAAWERVRRKGRQMLASKIRRHTPQDLP